MRAMFLVEINNRLQELKREEREEERKVLVYLRSLLEAELPGARAALELLAQLDVLQAKRRLAALFDGRPLPLTPVAEGIQLLDARHPLLMLTEGYMDVLTLHQFGYDNAVGVLGTALTPEQIKRLSGFASQMTLLFDGDRAGRKAALRSCEMLLTRGLSCSVVIMGPDALLNLDIFRQLADTALTSDAPIEEHCANGLPNTFVPGRNLIFILHAAAWAYAKEIRHMRGKPEMPPKDRRV